MAGGKLTGRFRRRCGKTHIGHSILADLAVADAQAAKIRCGKTHMKKREICAGAAFRAASRSAVSVEGRLERETLSMSPSPDAWHELSGAEKDVSEEELKRRRWKALAGGPPRRAGIDLLWPLVALAVGAVGVAVALRAGA